MKSPHPDIIFLDIQLNDGISFIFIEQAQPQSMIVFTTAYDEYAVRAFDRKQYRLSAKTDTRRKTT